MPAAPTDAILATQIRKPKPDIAALFQRARSKSGRSSASLVWDIARLARGPGKLRPFDYLRYELFRPHMTHAERAAFVSPHASSMLNRRLSPVSQENYAPLTVDKVLTGIVLAAAGFPVPEIRAVFSVDANYGALSRLRSAEDIAAFLRDPGNLPVFGKPVNGSQSVGAAAFVARAPEGDAIVLGDGRVVAIEALAAEIARHYGRGYLFEERLRQTPEVVALAGEAISSLRLVTLWLPGGPRALYAGVKLAAPGAMVDALIGGDNVLALIDIATGEMRRAMQSAEPARIEITHSHLNPDLPLIGVRLPHWAQAVAISTDAHRLFPGHGILGFDVAMTTRGAVITEVNTNPHHVLYQFCADRGMLNPEFSALFAEAEADLARRSENLRLRDAAFKATTR